MKKDFVWISTSTAFHHTLSHRRRLHLFFFPYSKNISFAISRTILLLNFGKLNEEISPHLPFALFLLIEIWKCSCSSFKFLREKNVLGGCPDYHFHSYLHWDSCIDIWTLIVLCNMTQSLHRKDKRSKKNEELWCDSSCYQFSPAHTRAIF